MYYVTSLEKLRQVTRSFNWWWHRKGKKTMRISNVAHQAFPSLRTRLTDSESLGIEERLNRWTHLQITNDVATDRILLPNAELHGGHVYGDKWAAARYCGFERPPILPFSGEWDHGVLWPDRPEVELTLHSDGAPIRDREVRIFARQDQVDTSRKIATFSSVAVGLPILYAAAGLPRLPQRIPRTLLVLPPHSTEESQEHGIDSKYITFVSNLAADFDDVVWCLHGSDILRDAHVRVIELGHKVVLGAFASDINSLSRTVTLFSIFDVVTTSALGSHVPYAAWLGSRVSVCGPEPHRTGFGDAFDHIYYRRNPLLAVEQVEWGRRRLRDEGNAFLLEHPTRAIQAQGWGAELVGANQVRSPDDLKKILGWSASALIWRGTRGILRQLARRIFGMTQRTILQLATPCIQVFGWKLGLVNFVQLGRAVALSSGESKVRLKSGRRLILRNGTSDPLNIAQHFLRKELTSGLPNCVNNFVDAGAYCGYAAAALLEQHPNCQVVCIEPDLENFAILGRNLGSLPNVTLIQAALWSDCEGVALQPEQGGKWATRVVRDGSSLDSVSSVTWESLLSEGHIAPRAIVKIDIEGAEVEVLSHSWRSLLTSAAVIFLEVHYWIPGISEQIAEIFLEAGTSLDFEARQSGEFLVIETEKT